VVDWLVKTTLHDKSEVSLCSKVVRRDDAVARLPFELGPLRIDHTNASTSSRTMECTRLCILLWRFASKRYSGSERRVDTRESHD
jgi:hypothetical protein